MTITNDESTGLTAVAVEPAKDTTPGQLPSPVKKKEDKKDDDGVHPLHLQQPGAPAQDDGKLMDATKPEVNQQQPKPEYKETEPAPPLPDSFIGPDGDKERLHKMIHGVPNQAHYYGATVDTLMHGFEGNGKDPLETGASIDRMIHGENVPK